MVPELLAGLSHEEAALITDVLSQLSLGGVAVNPIPTVKEAPARGVLPDVDLQELELAEQAIEQELRGLQASGTLGRAEKLATAVPPANTFDYQPLFAGPVPHLPSSARQAPVPGAEPGKGVVMAGPGRCSTPADTAGLIVTSVSNPQRAGMAAEVQKPGPVAGPFTMVGNWVMEHGLQSAGPVLLQEGLGSNRAAANADHLASGDSYQPQTETQAQQRMSLLQSMREKLRQQEQSQSRASVAASNGYGSASRAADAQSVQPSSSFHTPAERGMHGYSRSDEVYKRSHSASSAAPSAAQRQRRSPIPPLNSAAAAKAFTMLNARTNPERYGSDVGNGDANSSATGKTPMKLPEDERSARLQQLYERTWQWRKRCEERYAKERQQREASELEGCTFSPQITTASQLIMQGKPPSEVYNELSFWSTPTKHSEDGAPLQRHHMAYTISPDATFQRAAVATDSGSGLNSSIGRSGESSKGSRGPAVTGTAGSISGRVHGSSGPGSSISVSPSRVVVNGPEVGARLYKRAVEQRARMEERVARQLEAEERARRFTALVQGVSPRLYNPPEPSARHLPTGMEECTFHPRTRYQVMSSRAFDDGDIAAHQRFDNRSNSRGSIFRPGYRHDAASSAAMSASVASSVTGGSGRAKSAPHLRGGSDRPQSAAPSVRYGGASSGHGKQPPSHAGTHMTVSISPELDWDEFLARQERFLADRQHKIQSLEQDGQAALRMSPGSRRLLRERSLRESIARPLGPHAEGSGEDQISSQKAASVSPGRQDRRLRTVLEMYKECTFQPRITRKAAALPSRNVDDLVDGGRSRRDEWMEQQRALQQMREVEGATFKPQRNTNDAYSHVRPRISLKNVDAYLMREAHKQQQREALRAELENEREALELQHCTFKPHTTPLPAYLIRRLQEQHLHQLQTQQYEQHQQHEQAQASASWDYGIGEAANGMPPGEAYAGQHGQLTGSSAFQGSKDGYGVYAAEVPDEAEYDADSAYQRALQYAAAHGVDYM